MLLPIFVAALLCLIFVMERRRFEAWKRDPSRPWNIAARLQQEAIDEQRRQYEKRSNAEVTGIGRNRSNDAR